MKDFLKASLKPKRAESPDESGRGRICVGLGLLVGDFLVLFFTHESSAFKGIREGCAVR